MGRAITLVRGESTCSVKDSLGELGLVSLEDRWHLGGLNSSYWEVVKKMESNSLPVVQDRRITDNVSITN